MRDVIKYQENVLLVINSKLEKIIIVNIVKNNAIITIYFISR